MAGEREPKGKMTIADQAMERFRQRARVKKEAEAVRAKNAKRNRSSIFGTSIWLILWTAMNGVALLSLYNRGGDDIYVMIFWFLVAAFVWWKVARKLFGLITGEAEQNNRPDQNF